MEAASAAESAHWRAGGGSGQGAEAAALRAGLARGRARREVAEARGLHHRHTR
jgi:hypothetical protein